MSAYVDAVLLRIIAKDLLHFCNKHGKAIGAFHVWGQSRCFIHGRSASLRVREEQDSLEGMRNETNDFTNNGVLFMAEWKAPGDVDVSLSLSIPECPVKSQLSQMHWVEDPLRQSHILALWSKAIETGSSGHEMKISFLKGDMAITAVYLTGPSWNHRIRNCSSNALWDGHCGSH